MWGKDLQFEREIPIHKNFEVLALVANIQDHIYSSGRDGSLRYFRVPWRTNNNDILIQAVAADVTGDENITLSCSEVFLIYNRFFTALCCVGNLIYSGDDKGIINRWYNNRISCQLNVMKEVLLDQSDKKRLFIDEFNC